LGGDNLHFSETEKNLVTQLEGNNILFTYETPCLTKSLVFGASSRPVNRQAWLPGHGTLVGQYM
jgi:hypothetical protein